MLKRVVHIDERSEVDEHRGTLKRVVHIDERSEVDGHRGTLKH